jgi:hypothetical protein
LSSPGILDSSDSAASSIAKVVGVGGVEVDVDDWFVPDHPPPKNAEGSADDWTVYVNFGGDLLDEFEDGEEQELWDLLEVIVKHDGGETVRTVDVGKIRGVEDVAVGTFKFQEKAPSVVIRPPASSSSSSSSSSSRRQLTISHVAYRQIRQLGVSFDWQAGNSGCKSPVGDQGSCGDCYAWAAAGIANERSCKTGSSKFSIRQLACEAEDFMNSPGNGGCNGGWVDRNLDYLASDGICDEGNVDWPWYCLGDDCLECGGNWYGASKAKNPSCSRKKLTGTNDWRTLGNIESDTAVAALKTYLQSEGTFGYNFEVNNDFMFMGSNLGGWFGSDCDNELPYVGGNDSCCRKKKKRVCSWWGSCRDKTSECDGTKGGHAVRVVGWGTRNGEVSLSGARLPKG